jgi:mono/diheme cytochrome c family protein
MNKASTCDFGARDGSVGHLSRARTHIIVRTIRLLSLAALMSDCTSHPDSGWDWNRMRAQPKVVAYDDKPGSNSLRLPPVGTLSRESGAADSGRFAAVNVSRGKMRYDTFCAVCHGPAGTGGALVGSMMQNMKPPVFVRDSALPSNDSIFAIVTEGRDHMPGFAAKISAADRWQIVAYVATLRPRTAQDHKQ